MYRQFIIKSLQEEKMSLGDKSASINTILIEAEVKRSFIEKFTKKAEILLFSVINNSEIHKRARKAYMSNSSWEIDMDDFSQWSIKDRFIYLNKEIIEEKNKYIKKKQEEREAAKAAEQKAKQQAEERAKQQSMQQSMSEPQKEKPKAPVPQQASEEELDLNNIQPCFNPMALPKVKMTEQFSMHPITENNLENDAHTLSIMLMFDNDTRKYMHDFAGPEAREKIPMYLVNSVMTQSMGIAFCYIIRMNAGICGLIKVTSPTHNKVTNNFNHWLIDYILIPPLRGHKIMKSALPIVFDIMKNRLGINDPVYAMVIPGNNVSIHLLELNGFKLDESSGMSVDPTTGDRALVYKKLL